MIGKIIIKYDVIDSTNDYIKQNVDKLVDGTVITAKSQTKGRGRRENLWQSLFQYAYSSFNCQNSGKISNKKRNKVSE